jgi:hypothetical protein
VRKDGSDPKKELRIGRDFLDDFGELALAVPTGNSLRLTEAGARPLLARADAPYAASVRMEDGEVIVFADEALFTNASLAAGDNALFLVDLFEDLKQIQIADESTGDAAQSPLASIKRGKLMPLTLQLGALLILFFIYRGTAFGTLRDPPSRGRRAFVDHVRALGSQYKKAYATRHALALYSAYALERMRELAQPGGRGGLTHLAESIAQRTGRPIGDVMRLLVEARTARENADARTPSAQAGKEDLELLRELAQLVKEIGGTREHRRG